MASTTYYTILTKVGQAKIANAIAYGRQLQITQFALGDGNGASYEPDESQTALKHEVYRANVSNVVVSDQSINMLEVNMAVPADQGGWVVREMGVYDADGDLIAISKTPDDPKPGAGSGAAKDVVYRLFIVVANTDAVEIKIDPTVAVATKAEVQAAKEQLQEQIDALSQTLNSEIATLAGVVNGIQHYNTFADIDPAYTNDTLFATVYNAMVNNSILRTQVSANATDYPADGLLEVIKQDANHGACTLSAGDGIYTLTITPENIEQIFGGALNKWSKAAREADLTELGSEIDGISDKIGETADSNGSQVAGSVMAKQNKALADLVSLGINMKSIISKLDAVAKAMSIKRVSTKLQACAFDRSGVANYWPYVFAKSGLVIISSASAGSDSDANSTRFIMVTDYDSGEQSNKNIGMLHSFEIYGISKTGFYLRYIASVGSQSGTVNFLITSIEFN